MTKIIFSALLLITSTKIMRILIVSHNASYQFGGEAAIPLRFFEKMRDRNIDSILVTHARVREELEQILKREDRDRVYFVEENWVQTWLWLIEQLCPHPIDMILRILRVLHTDSKQRQVILKFWYISQFPYHPVILL